VLLRVSANAVVESCVVAVVDQTEAYVFSCSTTFQQAVTKYCIYQIGRKNLPLNSSSS